MKKIIIAVAIQFLLILNLQAASDISPDKYNAALRAGPMSAGAMPEFQNKVGLDGIENIRIKTGTLNLVHTDISLPVSKDLSIDIMRYYTSPAKIGIVAETNNGYAGGKSVLGIGWDIHMGRILNSNYPKGSNFCKSTLSSDDSRGPVLELPDGTRDILYNAKTTGQGAVDFALISANYWVADCTKTGGMLVYSPDGLKYFFEENSHIKDKERPAFSVTRVEDKNGNYYTVSYKNVSVWDTGDSNVASFNIRAIDKITAQDGRTIVFNYDTYGLASINVLARPLSGIPVQTWLYQTEPETQSGYFRDFYLMSVSGPEGYAWQYDYIKGSTYNHWATDVVSGNPYAGWYAVPGMFGMSQIITPYGAQVNYSYHARQASGSKLEVSALAMKTITGPGIDQPRVWKYKDADSRIEYDQSTNQYKYIMDDPKILPYIADLSNDEITKSSFYRVEGPDTIEIHRFCRFDAVEHANIQEYGWLCRALIGRATETRVFKKILRALGDENTSNVVLLETTKYVRLTHAAITDQMYYGTQVTASFPVELQTTIIRDGESFNTLFTNFDEFYNPQLISEFTGTPLTDVELSQAGEVVVPDEINRKKKQTRYTYINVNVPGERWIKGLLESITIIDTVGSSYLAVDTPNIFNAYDLFGNIESVKKHNAETRYTYHQKSEPSTSQLIPTGDLKTITDPLNKVTNFSQYRYGIAQDIRQHNGDVTSRVVDSSGNVTSSRNARGFTTSYRYDGLNRIKKVITPRIGDNDINYYYSWVNTQYKRMVGAYIENIQLDGLGNIIKEDKGGIITTYKYDVLGRQIFKSYPGSTEGEAFKYNALGQLIEKTNTADDSVVTYEYPSSLKTIITDEENNKTQLTYRAFSNPDDKELVINDQWSATDGSIVTILERTQRGDVFRVAQGKHNGIYSGNESSLTELSERIYYYDDNYLLERVHHPETGMNVVEKNAVGNQISRQVDTLGSASGVTNYTYDDLHRLSTVLYPSVTTADLVYTYDENNNTTKITSGGIVLDYTYDENDNLQTETLTVDGAANTIVYTYNANNVVQTMEYPDGLVIDYQPNDLGQATQVSGFVSNIEYHPNGQINTLTYLNGQNITINQNNRLFTQSIVAGSDADIVNLAYTYDGVGNTKTITDKIDRNNDLTLGYDAFNRLVQADGSWGGGSVSYNSRGDISRKTIGNTDLIYNYNISAAGVSGAGTKLETITDVSAGTNKYSFNYDAYGNVRSNGVYFFTYNDASQLTTALNPSGPYKKYNYRYDGNGNRAEIDENGFRYAMYSQSGSLLYEYDKKNETTIDYIRVGSFLVARRDILGACPTLDTDRDSVPDCVESRAGLNPFVNDGGLDLDGDGLTNSFEYGLGTRIDKADTDGDGIPDGFEFNNQLDPLDILDGEKDNDGDLLSNLAEYQLGLALYVGIDLNKKDTDGDGLDDKYEIDLGLSPILLSSDADIMSDGYEVANNLNPFVDDGALDLDGDGVANSIEYTKGTFASDKLSMPDGYLKWKFIADSNLTGPPVVDDNGVVYFITEAGFIYAVEPDESLFNPVSNYKWRINLPGQRFTNGSRGRELSIGPDGTLYVIGDSDSLDPLRINQTLNAISPSGKVMWAYNLLHQKALRDSELSIGIDGTIYFALNDLLTSAEWDAVPLSLQITGGATSRLLAITPSGKLKWEYYFPEGYIRTPPTIGLTGYLHFYDIGTGYTTLEDQGTSGVVINSVYNSILTSEPSIVKGTRAVIGDDGRIHFNRFISLNSDGGLNKYTDQYADENTAGGNGGAGVLAAGLNYSTGNIVSSVLIEGGGRDYFFSINKYSLFTRFSIVGGLSLDKGAGRSIAVSINNTIYSPASDGTLYAIEQQTGSSPLWEYTPLITSNLNGKGFERYPLITDEGDVIYAMGNMIFKVSASEAPSQAWPMHGRDRKHTYNACNKTGPDSDDDQIPDCYEIQYGLSATNPLDAQFDTDTDGLTNLEEYLANTNPNAADTDADGVSDKIEVRLGLNPLYGDTNSDGIDDATEYQTIFFTDIDNDGYVGAGDNCLLVYNPVQLDSDNDRIGNACDADFNNDNVINLEDIIQFKLLLTTDDAIADINEDGVVTGLDYSILRSKQKAKPGPSGILVGE